MKLELDIAKFSVKTDIEIRSYVRARQFFYLYAYLAYERKYKKNYKFISIVNDILQLPYWREKNQESVGKEIRRHISSLENQNKNIIDYETKVKGGFRLIPDIKEIIFYEKTKNEVKDFLAIDIIPSALQDKEREDFYKYTLLLIKGRDYFNQGNLEKAQEEYEKILRIHLLSEKYPEHKINLLYRKATILERLGNWKESFEILEEASKLLQKSEIPSRYIPYLKSKLFSCFGFLYFRKRELTKAKKYYENAKKFIEKSKDYSILGNLHNGLGLISLRSEGKESNALAWFDQALNYYLLSEEIYGIQAVYFNIANTFYKIYARKVRPEMEWYLNKAETWATRAKELTDLSKTGKETAQTEILLSIIFLEEKKLKQAYQYAKEAEEIATKAENKYDLATTNKVLGIVYFKKKDFLESKTCFEKSKNIFEKLGREKPLKEINAYLNNLKSLGGEIKKPQ